MTTATCPHMFQVAALRDGRPLPPRAVALTFDDGYADNLTLAAPLLRSMRLPATFFLVPGFLSGAVEAWWEVVAWAFSTGRAHEVEWQGELFPLDTRRERIRANAVISASLKRMDRVARTAAVEEIVGRTETVGRRPGREMFLDWAGARSLLQQGFAVGSHTSGHDILSQETPERQVEDLTAARAALERELSAEVPLLAYPNGTVADYDSGTLAAAAAAGHQFAMTTTEAFVTRACTPLEVPRCVIYPERGALDIAAALRAAWRSALAVPQGKLSG